MRLWLSRSSQIPIREQLITQITLGVVSGDLEAGEKLPSTRELGRRFRIHSNTVSAAYRELQRRGLLVSRRGSGVYVIELREETTLVGSLKLDRMASQFIKSARQAGFSLKKVRSSIDRWLNLQPPDHVLVIEPDVELRRILIAKVESATAWRARGATIEECRDRRILIGAAPVAMYPRAKSVSAVLRPSRECLFLHSTSVASSLKGEKSPPIDALVAVASRWPGFLNSSRTILVAAGLNAEALDFRDARAPGWRKGLRSAALVITDSVSARNLPPACRVRAFPVISDSSLADLRAYLTRSLSEMSTDL